MHDDTLAAALLSVLVVGDHVRWIEVVADYFRREEVSVVVADNGVDTLTIAEGIRPGMIILDMDLPGVDVVELCRRLRRFSDAHIIMWTACGDEATVLAGSPRAPMTSSPSRVAAASLPHGFGRFCAAAVARRWATWACHGATMRHVGCSVCYPSMLRGARCSLPTSRSI